MTTALGLRAFRRIRSRDRAAKRTLAIASAVCGLFLLGPAAPANAAINHVLSGSFSSGGQPHSLAVDKSTGNVYVLNNSGVVTKYTAAGVPENFSAFPSSSFTVPSCGTSCRQIAVDNSGGPNQGVIYIGKQIATNAGGGINVYLPSGAAVTIIKNRSDALTSSFCGVGIDDGGNIYTTHANNNINNSTVERFQPPNWALNPTQIPTITGFMGGPLGVAQPCKMSVNSLGNMFVIGGNAVTSANIVQRLLAGSFGGPGVPEPQTTFTALSTAVDLSNDELYVDIGNELQRFNVNGDLLEAFGGGGTLTESAGVAVNPANHTVYASNRVAGNVKIFSTIITPDATTGAAQAGQTGATLNGVIDTAGAGNVTNCKFEYGTSTKPYSTVVPCTPDASGTPFTGTTAVSTTIAPGALNKETLYHYRVTATNANGTTNGIDKTFTTHNVADLLTEPASQITKTTATLNGSFTGNGEPTTFSFEWGPTAAYGNKTTVGPSPSNTGHVELSAPITGLVASGPTSTPYHFRVVATNGSGTTLGADQAFMTKPADPPIVQAIEAFEVSSTTAGISSYINPNGADTIYFVEYGPTTAYGSSTLASDSIGAAIYDYHVTTTLTELTPGVTYHYRVAAVNYGGVSYSVDQTFDTPSPPAVLETSVGGITKTEATVSAQILPGFRPITFHVEYGNGGLSSSSPETSPFGASNTVQGVAADLAGLAPGTAYSYRVVATNVFGTTSGPIQTFTTNPADKEEAKPPPARCRKGFVRRHGKCVKRKRRHRSRRGSRSRG